MVGCQVWTGKRGKFNEVRSMWVRISTLLTIVDAYFSCTNKIDYHRLENVKQSLWARYLTTISHVHYKITIKFTI